MLIRTATRSDMDALIALYGDVCDAMIGTPFDCLWRRGEHPSDVMIADAVCAGTLTIADDGGTVAAAVIVNGEYDASQDPGMPWIVPCSPEEMAVIHVLASAPAYRGAGVARELLLHVIDKARAEKMHTVRLGVALNNTPAVKLYETCGFIRICEGVRIFVGQAVPAAAFELPLI